MLQEQCRNEQSRRLLMDREVNAGNNSSEGTVKGNNRRSLAPRNREKTLPLHEAFKFSQKYMVSFIQQQV